MVIIIKLKSMNKRTYVHRVYFLFILFGIDGHALVTLLGSLDKLFTYEFLITIAIWMLFTRDIYLCMNACRYVETIYNIDSVMTESIHCGVAQKNVGH